MLSVTSSREDFLPECMDKALEIKVETLRLELSLASEKALARLETYNWILFTSKNAVEYFWQELRERKLGWRKDIHFAAVGPMTAEALRRYYIRVDVVPPKATVKDMVRALGTIRGKKILFPRSLIAEKDVISKMRKAGAKVTVIPLYTSQPMLLSASKKKVLVARGYSSIMFKSPSGVQGLMGQLTEPEKRNVRMITAKCVGLTTAMAARKAGFRNVVDTSI
jgi:uroporphyrinogen III methyltransferase/synthase